MTYNVINTSPTMATNTTHLTELVTSAAMSCLDLSNKSVRHLLVYGAGAGSLPFSTPPVPGSMSSAGTTLDVTISVFRDIYIDYIGGNKTLRVNVRLIAATNRELERMVDEDSRVLARGSTCDSLRCAPK